MTEKPTVKSAEQRAATAEARADDARAETARAREDAARELAQLRADAERERDEILARLTDTATRLSQVTTAHAEELAQLRTEAARERDELRAALDSRAQVLEESRNELRARAERAERELNRLRAAAATKPTRSRWKKIRKPVVLAVIGLGLILAGWFFIYPRRAEAPAPASDSVEIRGWGGYVNSRYVDSHMNAIYYTVQQLHPDVAMVSIQVVLNGSADTRQHEEWHHADPPPRGAGGWDAMREFGPLRDWTGEGVFIAGDGDGQHGWDAGPAHQLRLTGHLIAIQTGGSRHG